MGETTETVTENATKGSIFKVLCTKCNGRTNHCVLVSADVTGQQEYERGIWIQWENNYQVVRCGGCDTVSFLHRNWHSENQDFEWNGVSVEIYPQRDAVSLKIKEFPSVPATLRRIYRESVKSFNGDCLTLCAAGLRGLVEGICADKGVVSGEVNRPTKGGGTEMKRVKDLEGKIAGLCEKGILTELSANTLHGHRFLGNEAVHELSRPTSAELKLAIEIVEHTLEQLYEIPEKSVALRRQIANRKPKVK